MTPKTKSDIFLKYNTNKDLSLNFFTRWCIVIKFIILFIELFKLNMIILAGGVADI